MIVNVMNIMEVANNYSSNVVLQSTFAVENGQPFFLTVGHHLCVADK
jgi:hypothetical protein